MYNNKCISFIIVSEFYRWGSLIVVRSLYTVIYVVVYCRLRSNPHVDAKQSDHRMFARNIDSVLCTDWFTRVFWLGVVSHISFAGSTTHTHSSKRFLSEVYKIPNILQTSVLLINETGTFDIAEYKFCKM